jgi:GntR family transcriptional regulator
VTIDHEGDVTIYLQLAAILRGQIERGELAPRRPLPSINRLAQQYGVARGTVEKAVQVLRDEGLVRTVIGRGVYVVPQDSSGRS